MAPIYGIKIAEECNVVYGILNEFSDKFSLSGGYSFDEAMGESFKDCRKEIDEVSVRRNYISLMQRCRNSSEMYFNGWDTAQNMQIEVLME